MFSQLNCNGSEEDQDPVDNEDDDEVLNEIKDKDKEQKEEEIKPKKKKRHRKARNQNSQRSADQTDKVDSGEDEIERTVREVNKLLGEPVPSTSQENNDNSKSFVLRSKEEILTVQHRNLNPFNELKRIFGSKTVQAEEKFVFLFSPN